MTEQEWLSSTDPAAMLAWLTAERGPSGYYVRHNDGRPLGARKLRLWCAALFDLSEYGYGEESFYLEWREGERGRGKHRAGDEYEGEVGDVARMWTDPAHDNGGDPPMAVRAALLREIVGNPFRPVTLEVRYSRTYPVVCTPVVLSVARAAYETREWDRLPVLADALEDAGCPAEVGCERCKPQEGSRRSTRGLVVSDDDFRTSGVRATECPCRGTGRVPNPILDHLRGPGPHARGCWALDALLGLG